MKTTINFVLVAFLILLGSAKSDISSAPPLNEKLSVSELLDGQLVSWWRGGMAFPLWCGDKVIDDLVGTVDIHITERYENGTRAWIIITFSGTFTGKFTGEVFKYKELNKQNIPFAGDYTFHINAIGDKGGHFIMSGTYLADDPWVIFDRAVCK